MRKIALSISEIKDIEKREFLRLGDSFKLMEQAGEACAKQIIKIYKKNRFIVVCGPGNNGMDGKLTHDKIFEKYDLNSASIILIVLPLDLPKICIGFLFVPDK